MYRPRSLPPHWRVIKPLTIGEPMTKDAMASQLLPSLRRRRLLVGGNSDQVAIERNGPVD